MRDICRLVQRVRLHEHVVSFVRVMGLARAKVLLVALVASCTVGVYRRFVARLVHAATGAVSAIHRGFLLFLRSVMLIIGVGVSGYTGGRYIEGVHAQHSFELVRWLLRHTLDLKIGRRVAWQVDVDGGCLLAWVHVLVALLNLRLLLLMLHLLLLLLLLHMLLLEFRALNRCLPTGHMLNLLRSGTDPLLCRINEDVFYASNFLPQHLILLRQVLVLHLLKLYPLIIDVLLALDLIVVQTLLLVPGLFHLGLDLLKLCLHLLTVALIVSS